MANKIITTLSKLSLGLVLIGVWGFMWIRRDLLFPVNTEAWTGYILTYILFVTLAFSFDTIRGARTEKALFRVSFFKGFGRFLISAGISLAVLFAFGLLIKGTSLNSVSEAISSISFGVLVFHAFMIAIFEELFFRGWVTERLREGGIRRRYLVIGIQAVGFSLFHAFMGKSFMTMLIYIPLGITFFWIKEKWSPRTNMANAGAHFSWNVFILGFLP